MTLLVIIILGLARGLWLVVGGLWLQKPCVGLGQVPISKRLKYLKLG